MTENSGAATANTMYCTASTYLPTLHVHITNVSGFQLVNSWRTLHIHITNWIPISELHIAEWIPISELHIDKWIPISEFLANVTRRYK